MSVEIDGYLGASPAAPVDATAEWQAANQRRLLAALAGWVAAVDGVLVDRGSLRPSSSRASG